MMLPVQDVIWDNSFNLSKNGYITFEYAILYSMYPALNKYSYLIKGI